MAKQDRLILFNDDAEAGLSSEELAKIVLNRLGLCPRKKGSTDAMHKVLLELYERQKQAVQMKDPALGIVTVDEMALYANISRQTMYEYLGRWLQIDLIQKVSFLDNQRKLIVGYKLRGNTLEDAFKHVRSTYTKHLDETEKLIQQLQKLIKNEKIKASMQKK